jgi:hypothetical protein
MFTAVLLACLLLTSSFTIAEDSDFVEVDAAKLPDFSPAPSGDSDARINALIEQLKTAIDLQNTYANDLKLEKVQNSIVENNPYLMALLPDTLKLHSKPIKLMAKKIYRFDFFIPFPLRNQIEVKNAFKEFSKSYPKELHTYLNAAMEEIRKNDRIVLVHPDFLYNPEFMKLIVSKCQEIHQHSWRRNPNYQALYDKISRTIAILNKRKIFDLQHKEIFLQTHPREILNLECYPADLLDDLGFITQMEEKFKHSNFTTLVFNKTRNPKLKTEALRKKMESIMNDFRFPSSLEQLTEEDLTSEVVQQEILKKPGIIVKIKSPIPFSTELLTQFLSQSYKPERFFNENQKQVKAVSEFLNMNKNDSPESLLKERNHFMSEIPFITCCGTTASRETRKLFENLPSDLIKDSELHKEALKVTRSKGTYLQELIAVTDFPQGLKDYLTSECQEGIYYPSFTSEWAPKRIKDDINFYEKLKTTCKSNEVKSTKTSVPFTRRTSVVYIPSSTAKTNGTFKIGSIKYLPAEENKLQVDQIDSKTESPFLINPPVSVLLLSAMHAELSKMGIVISNKATNIIEANIQSFKFSEDSNGVVFQMAVNFQVKKDGKECFKHGLDIMKNGTKNDKPQALINDLIRMHIEIFGTQSGLKKCN